MKKKYFFLTITQNFEHEATKDFYERLINYKIMKLGLYRSQVECYERKKNGVLHYHGIMTSNKGFITIPKMKGLNFNLQKMKTMQDVLRVSEYICKNKVDSIDHPNLEIPSFGIIDEKTKLEKKASL